METLIDLDFVAQNYAFILVDTCALQSIDLKNCKSDIDSNKKLQEDEHMFLNFLKERAENHSNFYFPASIPPEINPINCKFNYKKMIKRVNNLENYDTELLRLIRDNKKLRRLTTADSSGNIIRLDDLEIGLYKTINKKYPYLPLDDKYKISPVDYDFLIQGVVLFFTRGSVALLSNDKGIFKSMKEINCGTDTRKFCFYLRKNFPYVERLS